MSPPSRFARRLTPWTRNHLVICTLVAALFYVSTLPFLFLLNLTPRITGVRFPSALFAEHWANAVWRRRLAGVTEPDICFIVRVMPAHAANLPALLFSIFASANPSVRVFLLRTFSSGGAQDDVFHVLADYVNAALPERRVEVSGLDSDVIAAAFPGIARGVPTGDGGFPVTDLLLEEILDNRRRRGAHTGAGAQNTGYCDSVVVTNGDNLYAYNFIPAVMEALADHDVVGTWFISRYINDPGAVALMTKRGRVGGPTRFGRDYEFNATLAVGGIDLGAVAFRTDLLATHGTRFVIDRLRANPTGAGIDFVLADGEFFANLKRLPGARSTVLERSLFVHQ